MGTLTVKETAAYLVETGRRQSPPHHSTVKRWINRRRNPLPAVRAGRGHSGRGGEWLIETAALDAWELPHAGRPRKPRGN